MLHKGFDHALERLELFMTGKTFPLTENIAIKSQFYFDKIPVKSLKVIRNTDRVKPSEMASRISEFKEEAKIGDKFGKSWETHWFLIEIEIPEEWTKEDKEVHFIWNGKCEAAIYDIKGSKLLSAITENVREVYLMKRPGVKDDFTDQSINKDGSRTKITYLLEMACNEMFGNFSDGFNTPVDMNREFELKKCEIGLFNKVAWDLFYNFELLKDGAKLFEQT
jgi:hypothetical protein